MQDCRASSTGNFAIRCYSYPLNNWVAQVDYFNQTGALSYPLDDTAWYVNCLYDKDDERYTGGIYVYLQDLIGYSAPRQNADNAAPPLPITQPESPLAAPDFTQSQTFTATAEGNLEIGVYNYAAESWVAQTEAYLIGTLNYDLIAGQWVVACLYDTDAGQWTELAYLYRENW